jgi:hypothetical protein
MYGVEMTFEGKAGILFNRYTDKSRPGKLRKEELLEEATRRVYRDPETEELILPGWNVLRCALDGARLGDVKMGKKAIGPYLQALLIVDGDVARFGRTQYDGLHEALGRIPPRTGPMVMLYRPKLDPGWELSCRLLVANSSMPPETLKQVFSLAGLYAGLGAWRPRYGRFVVSRFEVSEDAAGPFAEVAPPPKSSKAPRRKAPRG